MKKFFTSVAMALCMLSMSAKEYTCPLTVSMSGYDMPAGNIKVSVDEQENGKYTLRLDNFNLGGVMPVGNILVKDVEPTQCGNTIMLNAQQTIQITAGDQKDEDGNDLDWMGPGLGDVNILFKGELKGDNFNALLNIPVAGQLIVNVKLGEDANNIGQLPNSGFENFHTASYNNAYTSDEPNGWHSFMSSTGLLKGSVSTATHTFISEDVRKQEANDDSDEAQTENKSCVKIVSTPVKIFGVTAASANGTITTGQLNAGSATASDPKNNAFLNFENTATDGNGDPFYAVLNNKPDSIKVWVKFHAGEGNKNPQATISALLTNGQNVQDPEVDDYKSNIIARANKSDIESTDEWQQITIPFKYDNENEMPKAALVTISTCAVPSGGSKSEKDPDVLYVDDVELVYNADIKSIKLNGEELTGFDEIGDLTIDGYTKDITPESFEVEAEGAGAFVSKKITVEGNTAYACITVVSNDLKNSAVRTITFENVSTGIKNAQTVTLPNGVQAIYNLAGQKVSNMTSGQVYIIKTTDGKTKKVVMK